MIQITINNQPLEVSEGTTVLQAANLANIVIPTLCDHKDLRPYGGCRLCVVEIEGARAPMAACTMPIFDGMAVHTESDDLTESRIEILKLLLSNYYDANEDGPREESELLYWVRHYDIDLAEFSAKEPRYKIDSDANPFIRVDLNKCILCTRCIRACEEIQGRDVWSLAERGYESRIVAGADTDLLDGRCESCGACVAYCPTGALGSKIALPHRTADNQVTTTCTYCGVGCQFDLNVKDNQVISVTSNPDSPVNGMAMCVKGRYGFDFIHHPERLTRPRVRKYLLDGNPKPKGRGDWVEVDWDTALEITANKLRDIRDDFGGDSIGVLTSAKCLNEENYLMNKFARQVIGTNNIDHCARL